MNKYLVESALRDLASRARFATIRDLDPICKFERGLYKEDEYSGNRDWVNRYWIDHICGGFSTIILEQDDTPIAHVCMCDLSKEAQRRLTVDAKDEGSEFGVWTYFPPQIALAEPGNEGRHLYMATLCLWDRGIEIHAFKASQLLHEIRLLMALQVVALGIDVEGKVQPNCTGVVCDLDYDAYSQVICATMGFPKKGIENAAMESTIYHSMFGPEVQDRVADLRHAMKDQIGAMKRTRRLAP